MAITNSYSDKVLFANLRYRIMVHDLDIKTIGEMIGLSKADMCKRFGLKVPFSLDEISEISEILGIRVNELSAYFPDDGEDTVVLEVPRRPRKRCDWGLER